MDLRCAICIDQVMFKTDSDVITGCMMCFCRKPAAKQAKLKARQ